MQAGWKGEKSMDRLTKRNEADTAYYYPNCFKECSGLGYSSKCDLCDLQDKVCEKLGKYEDIGLTPEQITEIDKLYAEKCREVALLKKQIEMLQAAAGMGEPDGKETT